jgi:uncharacterized protein (DUF697 family)
MKLPFKTELGKILALMELGVPITALLFHRSIGSIIAAFLIYGITFCVLYLADSYYYQKTHSSISELKTIGENKDASSSK